MMPHHIRDAKLAIKQMPIGSHLVFNAPTLVPRELKKAKIGAKVPTKRASCLWPCRGSSSVLALPLLLWASSDSWATCIPLILCTVFRTSPYSQWCRTHTVPCWNLCDICLQNSVWSKCSRNTMPSPLLPETEPPHGWAALLCSCFLRATRSHSRAMCPCLWHCPLNRPFLSFSLISLPYHLSGLTVCSRLQPIISLELTFGRQWGIHAQAELMEKWLQAEISVPRGWVAARLLCASPRELCLSQTVSLFMGPAQWEAVSATADIYQASELYLWDPTLNAA